MRMDIYVKADDNEMLHLYIYPWKQSRFCS